MRILLTILIALVFGSCSMQKELHKNTVKQSEQSATTIDSTDTTKSSSVTEINRTTAYGDTLSGSMYFGDEVVGESGNVVGDNTNNGGYSDSIESNGVKVVVALEKTRTGYKAKVKAIAKPVSTVDHFKQTTTDNKGVAVKTVATVEKKSEASSKDVKKKTSWLGFGLIGLGILVLLGWYIIKKYKILLWLKGS